MGGYDVGYGNTSQETTGALRVPPPPSYPLAPRCANGAFSESKNTHRQGRLDSNCFMRLSHQGMICSFEPEVSGGWEDESTYRHWIAGASGELLWSLHPLKSQLAKRV
jgi:hypothetical protein